ncbi:MAG: TRAP transporter small permease subunit [Myxococcota bacterium]|nr:TRAP transporter small permease subunit [Myxococcota bacterium]
MKKILLRIDTAWAAVEKWMLVALVLAIILLTFGQVVLRNLFSTGMAAADVTIRHMVLWVGLLGASIAAKEKRHLSIDIASRLIPQKWFHLVELLLCLVTAVICALLLWASIKFTQFLYEWGTGTLEGGWALLAGLILPLAFGGVAVRFLMRAYFELVDFVQIIKKQPEQGGR